MSVATCLSLAVAQALLRNARIKLEGVGAKHRDGSESLVDLRRRLEVSFDNYLELRSEQASQVYQTVLAEVDKVD